MLVSRTVAISVALLVGSAGSAPAQLNRLGDRLRERLEKRPLSCSADEVESGGRCVPREPSPAAERTAAPEAEVDAPAPVEAGDSATVTTDANYDFVPGDTILFADDFTAERVGNFPRRLELEKGTFEVVERAGRRWLRSTGEGEFTVRLPRPLPERWTLEFEMTMPVNGIYLYPGDDVDQNFGDQQSVWISQGSVRANVPGKPGTDVAVRGELDPALIDDDRSLSRPVHIRLQADRGYMKVYVEERRFLNLPNMGRWLGDRLHFYFNNNGASADAPLLTALSINAGGSELYESLIADGRLAVPGIYFETGSDRIRSASSATLAEILRMLAEHRDLNLLVEGHTDRVGASDRNQVLSEQRAAAVVAYLVEHGVAPSRLQSVGRGDSQPAVPGDSPEDRQRNRRVELVVRR